jgi:hypothetical protein
VNFSRDARRTIEAAATNVTKSLDEFRRLRDDLVCIEWMSTFYQMKVEAAQDVLRFGYSTNIADMEAALKWLERSTIAYGPLAALTKKNYHFANSMQTSHRKIPFPGAMNGVGTNYHWSQVLPLYEKELKDFQTKVARLKAGDQVTLFGTNAPVQLNKANPEIAEPK